MTIWLQFCVTSRTPAAAFVFWSPPDKASVPPGRVSASTHGVRAESWSSGERRFRKSRVGRHLPAVGGRRAPSGGARLDAADRDRLQFAPRLPARLGHSQLLLDHA